jgi:uncharacterized membrane protein YgcG
VPPCALYVAEAQRALSLLPEAIAYLGGQIARTPHSTPLCHAQAALLHTCQMVGAGLEMARHALRLAPTSRRSWMLLARAQVLAAQPVAALRTLNSAPLRLLRAEPQPRLDPTPTPPGGGGGNAGGAGSGEGCGGGGSGGEGGGAGGAEGGAEGGAGAREEREAAREAYASDRG